MSLFPPVHPSICLSIRLLHTISQEPSSSDHNFWYTCVKWRYLRRSFHFFVILIFLAVRVKNSPKWKNDNYIHHMPYLRKSIAYDHDFWYTCVNNDISRHLSLHFFKFWFFQAVKRIKGQKYPKMKNNSYIHHAPYLRNSIAYNHYFWYT